MLVFCACGVGNRVPWGNSLADVAGLPEVTPARSEAATEESNDPLTDESRSQRGNRRSSFKEPPRDPNFCFNHQEIVAGIPCAACKVNFCADCIVTLQSETLCGPCKNFRLRSAQRSGRFSLPSLFSVILALITTPVGFCLVSATAQGNVPYFGLVALVLPLAGLLLGILGLRDIERNADVRGRSLAIAGVISALASGFLTVTMFIMMMRQRE